VLPRFFFRAFSAEMTLVFVSETPFLEIFGPQLSHFPPQPLGVELTKLFFFPKVSIPPFPFPPGIPSFSPRSPYMRIDPVVRLFPWLPSLPLVDPYLPSPIFFNDFLTPSFSTGLFYPS